MISLRNDYISLSCCFSYEFDKQSNNHKIFTESGGNFSHITTVMFLIISAVNNGVVTSPVLKYRPIYIKYNHSYIMLWFAVLVISVLDASLYFKSRGY